MAKKKEEKLSFGQVPTPGMQNSYTSAKYNWSGLNLRQTVDTGALSREMNISTLEAPYIVPSQKMLDVLSNESMNKYDNPIAMFGFEDFLAVIYRVSDTLKLDCIRLGENGITDLHTGIIANGVTADTDKIIRSMVQFNLYSSVNDVLDGQYIKKLLLFPDKKAMYFNIITLAENNKTMKQKYNDGEITDLNAMYFYNGFYHVWDNEKQDFAVSGGKGYFVLDNLEIEVKTFYNDGYIKTNDLTYSTDNPKTYYRRTNGVYTAVNNLSDGDSVTQYYEIKRLKDGYVLTSDTKYDSSHTYYKKNGNTFETVTGLTSNDNVVNFYEYLDNFFPPDDDCNKNCYWYNSFDKQAYRYVSVDGGVSDKAWRVSINPAFPNLKYVTVHLSRLFGVDDDRVYVSGFNDYTNWNLDVISTEESNAWVSAAQSNTKADGQFTGIAVYDNHVVCFKHDYMHEIYNNKNPFRLQDIYAEGCIDNRSIQEVDGKLFFVSKDNVKIYTGGNPRIVGYYLGIDNFRSAVSGTDGRNYYLFCVDDNQKERLFTYDTVVEQWSEQSLPIKKADSYTYNCDALSFAHNKQGMYMLCDDGGIYRLDTGDYDHDWSFETDLSTAVSSSSSSFKSVNIKHIRKIQMYAYIKPNSTMKVYALYDEDKYNEMSEETKGKQLVFDSSKDERTGMIPIRIKPRMTASYGFKLHFEGHGYVRIHSLEVYKTQGGELFE